MSDSVNTAEWVSWFRHASPYIKAHQNRTMVLSLSGEALASERLENLIHDLALLNSLGVKLVIVFGARPQIDAALSAQGSSSNFHKGLRVTPPSTMPSVLDAYGRLRAELEAKLSMGVINSPMHGASIRVVSGNFVTAKPMGVIDGIDYCCTGVFRKLDVEAVNSHLNNRDIVLIPALGYSATGEIFNLGYEPLSGHIASQLSADKLILFGAANGIEADDGTVKQLSVESAQQWGANQSRDSKSEVHSHLEVAIRSCQKGVKRAHLISYRLDAALLQELFTRDGSGTMISADTYDEIRSARLEDINGILELIRPLEERGVLVRRSRERVESELECFVVNVRDNAIIACAALYPYKESRSGELSCFAVERSYREQGRGDRILAEIIARASALGVEDLFVLTTQTEHWFKERGFESVSAERLPGAKLYNHDRNAKVLVRSI